MKRSGGERNGSRDGSGDAKIKIVYVNRKTPEGSVKLVGGDSAEVTNRSQTRERLAPYRMLAGAIGRKSDT